MGMLLILWAIASDNMNERINATAATKYQPAFVAMIDQANAQRARYGLQPVQADYGLMLRASNHTKWMVRSNSLTHSSGAAEIIASGQRTVGEAIQSWMNSRGHRSIMLGNYRYTGAACYQWNGRYYWCMQFSNSRYTISNQVKDLSDSVGRLAKFIESH